MEPGQFLSLLADDAAGKTYTRAYSIASAPRESRQPESRESETRRQSFDLCVNRVDGGFFSNLLCDMQPGEVIRCHGPHGLFTLKQPLADGLMVAAGTGIAPMRGFTEWLFPEAGADRSQGRAYWLVYEAPDPGELFYDSYFEGVAARHANFHYLPVLGSEGQHQQLTQAIARISPHAAARQEAPSATGAPNFDRYAYVCGLSEMVKAVRTELSALGWQKPQVLFERYD